MEFKLIPAGTFIMGAADHAHEVTLTEPFQMGVHEVTQAQYNLGVMHYDGEGVPQDYAEAVKWYRLAADQGYANAQYNLGVMCRDGHGVPQDGAEGVKWYRLAG